LIQCQFAIWVIRADSELQSNQNVIRHLQHFSHYHSLFPIVWKMVINMSRTQFSDQWIYDWFCPSFSWTFTHELCWLSAVKFTQL